MKIVKASAEIMAATPNLELVLEAAGRTCYKSEESICEGSADRFISKLRNVFKHESVLEHGSITVRFIVDRGVSHELVRHRLASFSQESTRYCNYSKDKFGGEITIIEPCFWPCIGEAYGIDADDNYDGYWDWHTACHNAEKSYFTMLEHGAKPQQAHSVLPNSLKTEVVMTANPREWLHVFHMRCAEAAHPQMREVMLPLRAEFAARWPSIFG